MSVAPLLVMLGLYLALGACFAVPFVMRGVNQIDPHAANGTWGFRLMIAPGVVFLWPLLARRWLLGATHPRPGPAGPEPHDVRHGRAEIAAARAALDARQQAITAQLLRIAQGDTP